MLSSPFDVFGILAERLQQADASVLTGYGLALGGVPLLVVFVRAAAKAMSRNLSDGGTDSASNRDESAEISGSGAGGDDDSERRSEKAKEEERKKTQDQLKELFDLFNDSKREKNDRQKTEKETEKLGEKRRNFEKLKEKYAEMAGRIADMIEKNLTPAQMARALISRTAEQIPEIELQSLIDAMSAFLRKNGELEIHTGVIGVDPLFEQRGALCALKRGDFASVLDFLECQAAEELDKAENSHRADVRRPALKRAADLYRAIGVLARPVDAERSFDALNKSREADGNNPLTEVLTARAYYESGKSEKAVEMLDAVARSGAGGAAARYAGRTASEIRTELVAFHAARIRGEYEARLSETEDRTRAARETDIGAKKRAQVGRANVRFAAGNSRERDERAPA